MGSLLVTNFPAQQNEVFHQGFFFQREQIQRKLRIYGGFLKKYLIRNLKFCVVLVLVKSLFNLNKRDATQAELRP